MAVVTVTTQVSSETASQNVLVFPITGGVIPGVSIVSAAGVPAEMVNQPNPTYTGTSVHVSVSGVILDASGAGGFGNYYGWNQFATFNDSVTGNLATGQTGGMRATSMRAMHVNLRDNLGTDVTDSTQHAVRTTQYSTTGTAVSIAANGSLNVTVVGGGGTGGTSATDSAAFTVGSGSMTPIGGIQNDTTIPIAAGVAAVPRITPYRGLHVNLRSNTGTEVSIGATGLLNVNIASGGGTGGTALTDSSAFTTASTSVTPIAAYFTDTPAPIGAPQAGGLRMSKWRSLWTTPVTESGVYMTDTVNSALRVSTVTMPQVIGAVAAGSTDAQAPVKVGGFAANTPPSAVVNGQVQNVYVDLNGRVMVGAVGFDGNGAAITGSAVLVGGWASTTPPTAAAGNGRQMPAWHDLNGRAHIIANVSSVFNPATGSAISITLANLNAGTAVARSSAAIDNRGTNYVDALVTININGGRPGGNSQALLWAYGSLNGGTNYTEGNSGIGTDASYAMNNPTALRYLGTVPMPYNSQVYTGGPFSVAAAFDGILPPLWGIVVQNDGSFPFMPTNSSAIWTGVARQLI